jgi:hypothetical protein
VLGAPIIRKILILELLISVIFLHGVAGQSVGDLVVVLDRLMVIR